MKEPWFHIVSEIGEQPTPTVRDIQLAACRLFNINLRVMVARRRTRAVTMPRHLAMYLSREITEKSFPTLGRAFKRDHTAVMVGARKIERLVAAGDKRVKTDLRTLRRELGRVA